MLSDEDLAKSYTWNKYRKSPARRPDHCDDSCRAALFCDMTSTEYF